MRLRGRPDNPSAGHGQGRTIDRTPLDAFVRERLAPVLMAMKPRDGLVADAANTFCLADEGERTVLIDSLQGPGVTLAQPLHGRYAGTWFDPRTGETRPMEGDASEGANRADDAIAKPSGEEWLLLLTRRQG